LTFRPALKLSKNSHPGSKSKDRTLASGSIAPKSANALAKTPSVRRTASGRPFTYNLRFPGQYYMAETGLNQNWNRDYDPLTGKYIESDPIGLGGGASTYLYASATPVAAVDPSGLLVEVIGHLAFAPVGRVTTPASYHAALYLQPDDPCHCSGTWPVTLGSQEIGGMLVGTPNYPGDAISHAQFKQVVQRPAGMSDCDFIRALISAAASYQNNLDYSVPTNLSGAMSPGQFNSNSFVSGVLQSVGATPPSINTGGQFQLPGYQNPIPLPKQQ
jgi:RHS repeat-associated protein